MEGGVKQGRRPVQLALERAISVVIVCLLMRSVLRGITPSPASLTYSGLGRIVARSVGFARTHGRFPLDIDELAPHLEPGEELDGWGRPIRYSLATDGLMELTSFGRDGLLGGRGEDADLRRFVATEQMDGLYRIRSIDGRGIGSMEPDEVTVFMLARVALALDRVPPHIFALWSSGDVREWALGLDARDGGGRRLTAVLSGGVLRVEPRGAGSEPDVFCLRTASSLCAERRVHGDRTWTFGPLGDDGALLDPRDLMVEATLLRARPLPPGERR